MTAATTLHVPALCCDRCVARVRRVVERLAGVQAVEGDLAAKRVTVTYEPGAVSIARIAGVMANEGYPVEP